MITSDDDLIARAQGGELAAFNALVDRYQNQVYSVALRYAADRYLAEDVTQETFLSAWRAIHSFRGGSFRAWLFRIAVNEARDLHRKSSRRPATSLEVMLEETPASSVDIDIAPGPEQVVMSKLAMRAVEKCLRQLPEEQRILVMLSDVQGLSYDEMSQALKLPLGTVKSRLNRGRAALRVLLREAGELYGGKQHQ